MLAMVAIETVKMVVGTAIGRRVRCVVEHSAPTRTSKIVRSTECSEATTEQTGRRRQRRSLLGVEAVAADFYDQQRNCEGIATVNFHTTIGKILSWRVCDMRVYSWLVCPVLPLEASETGVSDSWC